MEVYHPNDTFQFNHLHLSPPNNIPGGSYLTKYAYYDSKKPLYIQTPKTLSKQGVVVAGKKAHIDILFTGENEHDAEFIEWIADLEKRSVDLLYEKRHLWFTQELDKSDIENSFTSPIRAFKTGNYLVRVNLELNRIQTHIQPFLCKVFDENRAIVPVDYVNAHHNIISIVEFQGIKFTARSFQMELILRQVLVIPELPLFETCIITTNTNANANTTSIAEPLGKCEPTQTIDNDSAAASAAVAVASAKELVETLDKSLGTPDPEPQLYTSPASSALKHFECTEVDIDFKNISDVIDTKEPAFDVPPTAAGTTGTTGTTCKQNNSGGGGGGGGGGSGGGGGGGGLTLKKHKDVIYEMYKVAKRKAQEAKKAAIRAYLEAKEIKASYLLDDLDDFDSGSDDDI